MESDRNIPVIRVNVKKKTSLTLTEKNHPFKITHLFIIGDIVKTKRYKQNEKLGK